MIVMVRPRPSSTSTQFLRFDAPGRKCCRVDVAFVYLSLIKSPSVASGIAEVSNVERPGKNTRWTLFVPPVRSPRIIAKKSQCLILLVPSYTHYAHLKHAKTRTTYITSIWTNDYDKSVDSCLHGLSLYRPCQSYFHFNVQWILSLMATS